MDNLHLLPPTSKPDQNFVDLEDGDEEDSNISVNQTQGQYGLHINPLLENL